MHTADFELFADYYQFYLQDEGSEGDLSGSWGPEAVERMLAVAPGIVGVGTVRNVEVPVSLELLDEEPRADFDDFDHVTEASLSVSSGRIAVAGCTDYLPDATRFDLEPGTYRVRVSCSGLDTLSEDGIDGEDRYRVQLWRAAHIEPTVLKARAPR